MIGKKSGFQNKKNKTIVSDYLSEHMNRRKWYYITGSIAAVVMIITFYMLILPALTMEGKTICGKDEHVHTESCYSVESTEEASADADTTQSDDNNRVLTCGKEEHTHTKSCYPAEKTTEETQTDEKEVSASNVEVKKESGSSTTAAASTSTKKKAAVKKAATTSNKITDTDLILSTKGDNPTITKMTLSYKCPDATPAMTDWVAITNDSDVTLHEDDSMKLSLEYHVTAASLKASNYKMYYPLPDWMKRADGSVTTDMLDSNSKKIGTITTQEMSDGEKYLVGTFDSTWLDTQDEESVLSGTMSMNASLSADEVKSKQLTIGDLTIDVDYEQGVWEAKYGSLDLKKSGPKYIKQDDKDDKKNYGYDLLEYTLTVTSGGTDIDKVKVEDVMSVIYGVGSSNTTMDASDTMKEIVGVTTTETAISNSTNGPQETSTISGYTPGKISYAVQKSNYNMTWNIGTIKANETRTLTYQVRIQKKYTRRAWMADGITFKNDATLWAGDIDRETKSTSFRITSSLYINKYQIGYVPDDDGIGGTVTYAIKVSTYNPWATNTTSVDNIKVYDFIGDSNTKTLSAQDMVVDAKSFYLYNGDATTAEKKDKLDENASNKTQITGSALKITTEGDKFVDFTCDVGNLDPAATKTLVYSVHLGDSWYLNNNGSFEVKNRATVYDDIERTGKTIAPNSGYIEASNVSDTVTYSTWEQKYSGELQSKKQTISMDGDVYETAGSSATKSSDTSFDVAAGSYKYRVIVNQNGKLDVTNVSMTDTLTKYMKYTGYLRVDSYDTLKDETLWDEDHKNSVDPGELKEPILKTAWLKIDGNTSFSLKMADLGFSGENAYVLTYYSTVDYDGTDLYISATNEFNMAGGVVGSGGNYVLGGTQVSVATQAITSIALQSSKQPWYYDAVKLGDTEDPNDTTWQYGAMYWTIKLSGTKISSGTVIKDQVEGTNHKLVSPDSLVGIYCVGEDAQFSDIEALQKSDTEKMDSSAYDVSWDTDKNAVSISFNKDITIPTDEQYYVVIKTALTQYPFGTTNTYTYENSLYQKTATTNFAKVGDTVSQSITGKSATSKSAGVPFIFDGSYCWNASDPTKEHDTGNHKYKNYKKGGLPSRSWDDYASYDWELTEPGTYLEYSISAFQNGYIQGDNITFSDTLPEGMELACLRNGWFNKGSASTAPTATNVDIEELNDDPDWTRVVEENKIDCNAKTKDGTEPKMIYYYNKKTREVRWRMTNVNVSSGSNISFQLIVKITDEKVLLGAKTGSYTNQVKVYQDNNLIDKASCGPTQISKKAMTKSIGDAGSSGNRLPFKIVVNLAGEDLLSYSDTITVVDELSSDLTLDISSIKVTKKDGTDITKKIKISMEKTETKTYLRLTVPDDQKLTITYDTIVNEVPNTSISISNVAHWEGYDPGPDTEVKNSNFSYNLEGMVTVSGPASLKLTKRDAYDIMKTLSGATYSMQAATRKDDGTYELTGEAHTATTNEDGVLYFSNTTGDKWMNYNQIYCLTEITAPDGYDVDSTPQYILLAAPNSTLEYPSDIQVQRNSNQYDFEAVDNETPKPYVLPQTGGFGIHQIQIFGAFFLAAGTIGYVIKRKQKAKK